jgi:5-keto 4-deoxyuronate isomerase
MNDLKTEIHYTANPLDIKSYDATRLRKEFLLSNIFETDSVNLYIGQGNKVVEFISNDAKVPALFYINSATAHQK